MYSMCQIPWCYSRSTSYLERTCTACVKYLGVILDQHLTWKEHAHMCQIPWCYSRSTSYLERTCTACVKYVSNTMCQIPRCYSRSTSYLERTCTVCVKYLGVILDQHLTWKEHAQHVSNTLVLF